MRNELLKFKVSYGIVRVTVYLLNSVHDVHMEYYSGSRCRNGQKVNAFFMGTVSESSKRTGSIVLARNSLLEECVPHEVAHAVLHKLVEVSRMDDEYMAKAIGILTSRITRMLRKYGYIA